MAEQAQIRFIAGPQEGKVINVGRFTRMSFGRGEKAVVRVKDAMASKIHFVLEKRGEAFYIVDQKSTNGTHVNGEPVIEERIFHEDVIRIGSTEILLYAPDQQKASSTVHFFSAPDKGPPGARVQKGTEEMIRELVEREDDGGKGYDSAFLHLLYDLGKLVSKGLDLEKMAEVFLVRVGDALQAERGLIVNRDLEILAAFTKRGRCESILKPPLSAFLEDAVRNETSTQRLVGLDMAEADPDETLPEKASKVDVLCAPLRGPQGTVGAIYLDITLSTARPSPSFSKEHLNILALAGRHMGLAMERARLVRDKFLSEEKHRLIVESANDVIFTLTPEGAFDFANRRVEAVFGEPAPAFRGRPFLDLIPPEAAEGVRRHLAGTVEDRTARTFETEIVRPDGPRATVSFSLAPLEDDQGGLAGLLGVGRDVTRERKMQERMMQAERLASLGQLVSGMAHELNNPLTSIVGFAQMLSEDDAVPEKVAKRTRLIFREGERARNIVENLLTFARAPQNDASPVDLRGILTKALDLAVYDLQKAGVEVLTSFEDLPPVRGDAGRLLQAFLALITNALQAVRETGRAGRLVVKTWRIEENAHVSLEDDGPGIPPENLQRIFDPFFTTKDVGKGTGLGLSTCYKIVQSHGGTITVDATPGEGSTFEVVLPIDDEAKGQVQTQA